MIIGFTGTREGMTAAQRTKVAALLQTFQRDSGITRYIHGGCMGADYDFHKIVMTNPYRTEVLVHPSNFPKTYPPMIRGWLRVLGLKPLSDRDTRAAWLAFGATSVAASAPPFDRNVTMMRFVAEQKGIVVATPKGLEEEARSGTWHAVRHARKFGAMLCVVWPDGRELTYA